MLIGAVPTAAFVWLWLPRLQPVTRGGIAYLVAVVLLTAVYLLVAPWVDARAYTAAPYRWLGPFAGGRGGAFARPDRRGRLTLYGVWAEPRRRGVGSVLMRQVIHDTEPAGDLRLVAVNQAAARFYQRLGFVHVGRTLLGHRMILQRS
jgi:GNAT superfamily N-acetyltransferase